MNLSGVVLDLVSGFTRPWLFGASTGSLIWLVSTVIPYLVDRLRNYVEPSPLEKELASLRKDFLRGVGDERRSETLELEAGLRFDKHGSLVDGYHYKKPVKTSEGATPPKLQPKVNLIFCPPMPMGLVGRKHAWIRTDNGHHLCTNCELDVDYGIWHSFARCRVGLHTWKELTGGSALCSVCDSMRVKGGAAVDKHTARLLAEHRAKGLPLSQNPHHEHVWHVHKGNEACDAFYFCQCGESGLLH